MRADFEAIREAAELALRWMPDIDNDFVSSVIKTQVERIKYYTDRISQIGEMK